ncbi:aggrecan/versican proteoglycan [Holotrichia oblita]|uniref:Aggrecan/versican proteoglycan n=1 Tax=Holotrichia oblita TaxID=644536 RepID=A0ACB9SV28_HOLOL|nr:aggrecan/versican proteoglycan [Holotrichia oblita]
MDSTNTKVWLLNHRMMTIDPRKDIAVYPKVHTGLNPYIITMRQELHNLHDLNTEARKRRLFELHKEDFLQEERELREVGLAYINI